MQTVDIPLNHFVYRFRKPTYEEEFGLEVGAGGDSRRAVLQAALVNVSDLAIDSRAQAAEILNTLPDPVVTRVWVMYRLGSGSSPPGTFTRDPGRTGHPTAALPHRFAVQTRPALY